MSMTDEQIASKEISIISHFNHMPQMNGTTKSAQDFADIMNHLHFLQQQNKQLVGTLTAIKDSKEDHLLNKFEAGYEFCIKLSESTLQSLKGDKP